jgi:hypothetical protein
MNDPVKQIIHAILGTLLGIWIVLGAYLTVVGFMAAWYLGLLGLADLALASIVTVAVYIIIINPINND